MKLGLFLTGVGIMILLLVSTSGMFINMAKEDNYNITVDSAFEGVYTNQTALNGLLQNVTGVGISMDDKVQSAKDLPDDFSDPKKQRISAVLEAGSGAFGVIKSLFLETATVLGLPPIVLAVALFIFMISLTLAVIAAIFNRII